MAKQVSEAGRVAAPFAYDPNELTIIGLDTDHKSHGEHPLWDKRARLPVDENLAKDMLMNGFRGTIEARRNGDAIEVVFGRQRVKAARRAAELAKETGQTPPKVSVLIKKMTDEDALKIRIGENVHHAPLSVLEKADELKVFLAAGGTEEEACVTFDMTKPGLKNLMRMHDLDGHVRKAVERGDLSPSAAGALADLSREDQRVQLDKLLADAAKGIKPTRNQAKRTAAKKNEDDEEAVVPQPKRKIAKILHLDKQNDKVLDPNFVSGILWTLGELSSDRIKGLRGLEKELEKYEEEREARRAERAKKKAAKEKVAAKAEA